MFDFHFLFKISQLDVSWTGYHCSWYPLSINHDIQLELLLVGVFFPLQMPTTNEVAPFSQQPPPSPKKEKPLI
jgi:hypothetical protein